MAAFSPSTLLADCGKQDDAITHAEKKDAAAGVPAPGIAEVKAIAEEGFIYGLPIVMNYAVMYEYSVDKNSGQFKAPFNQIFNEARVFTYKDTAIITPPGIKKVFRSTTDFSLAAYRTQLIDPEDMPNVEKVQAGYKVQPLSAYLKQPAPPAAPAIDFPKIDKEMVKTNFFDYLDFSLQFAPRGPEEESDPATREHRHSAPARSSASRISRLSTRPPSCWR